MKMTKDLKEQSTHFDFGSNWREYSTIIGEAEIAKAKKRLEDLVGVERLTDSTFLDIGCGSGVHGVAALRSGVSELTCLDIDPKCVETAREVLKKFTVNDDVYSVYHDSVFDFAAKRHGGYEIVYSWGVLHHTGDLAKAISRAASFVRPGGLLVLALYRKTWFDWFWTLEKRWYSNASAKMQNFARKTYKLGLKLGLVFKYKSYKEYKETYIENRGMSLEHDIHDWLGGWPYETIDLKRLRDHLEPLGFRCVKKNTKRFLTSDTVPGLMGSGCNEYVFELIETTS